MIKVLIESKDNKINTIEIKGHANYAIKGQDIICAGVSAVLAGINNLQEVKKFYIENKDGYTLIKKLEEISFHDEIVLETIITSLKAIEESYGKYLTIKNL